MSKIIRRELRKRGFVGWVIKLTFIGFNLLMMVWLLSYWGSVSTIINNAGSDAGRAGGAVGATLGTGVLVFFWLAGAVILGFLTFMTRGRLTIVEERIE